MAFRLAKSCQRPLLSAAWLLIQKMHPIVSLSQTSFGPADSSREVRFIGYGAREISGGMHPFLGCAKLPNLDDHGGDLGWPCLSGGSYAGTTEMQTGPAINCFVFYLPRGEPNSLGEIRRPGVIIHETSTSIPGNKRPRKVGMYNPKKFSNHERIEAALNRCIEALQSSVLLDLTEMAWCVYRNFPLVSAVYPPVDTRARGRRLRGVAMIPGGQASQLASELGFDVRSGNVFFFHFYMPAVANRDVFYLTSVCALPPLMEVSMDSEAGSGGDVFHAGGSSSG